MKKNTTKSSAKKNINKGFTLIELLISISIIAVLAGIVAVSIGPREVYRKVRDAERSYNEKQLSNAFQQYTIKYPTLLNENQLGTGPGSLATPICAQGMFRDSSCTNIDALLDEGFLSGLPYDSVEPCPSLTGYSVYKQQLRAMVVSDYVGKLRGDDIPSRCIFDTVSPDITNIVHTLIADSAVITWDTDESATTQVEYGVSTSYGNLSTLDPTLLTSHSVTLEALLSYTNYHYRIVSRDLAGNTNYSEDQEFTTADTVAPIITSLPVVTVGERDASIVWATDEPATSGVEYDLVSGPPYAQIPTPSGTLVANHTFNLTNLVPNTTYYYRVHSVDGFANEVYSIDATFTTLPDTSGPVFSNILWSVNNDTITFTWDTDELSDSAVRYGSTTAYGNEEVPSPNPDVLSHSVSVSGLINETLYHFQLVSTDTALPSTNEGTTNDIAILIQDVNAPVATPVSVTTTYQSATVDWTTDEGSQSQIDYGTTTAYGSSTTLGTAYNTSHSQQITGLDFSTTYHYRIRTRDSAGNTTTTGDLTFDTDNIIPGVTVSSITANSATISWATSLVGDTQVRYGQTTALGGSSPSSPTNTNPLVINHSRTLTSLSTNTLYYYEVRSYTSLGLLATYTGQFTTLGDTTAPSISSVSVANRDTATPTISWNTNENADSEVEYGLTSAYGSTSGLFDTSPMKTNGHSFTFPTLSMNTGYYYRITSKDPAGNSNPYTGIFYTDDIAPVLTSGPFISGLTGNDVTISWTVDQNAIGLVQYDTDSTLSSPPNSGWMNSYSTSQSRSITGLSPNTTYYYRIRSKDYATNQWIDSTINSFLTLGDTTDPVISSVSIVNRDTPTPTINWNTDELADSEVEYGLTSAYGSTSGLFDASPMKTSGHSFTFPTLAMNTTYYYRIKSKDPAGNSNPYTGTFSTDNIAPVLVSGPTISSLTANSAKINWTVNKFAMGLVQYDTDPTLSSPPNTGWMSSYSLSQSRTISGLTGNTTYYYRIRSKDSANNQWIDSNIYSFSTDVTEPNFSAITSSSVGETNATITWTTNENADSQVQYGTTTSYGSFSPSTPNTTLVTNHSQPITGLQPNTLYHYRVRSRDANGNLGISGNYTFTTTDTTAPTFSNVASSNIADTSVDIAWTTNELSDSRVEYGTTTSYGSSTSINTSLVTSHNMSLSGLQVGTLYHYRVRSMDAAGNIGYSTDYTFTTTNTTPPSFSSINISSSTENSLTIIWTTDQPSDSQVEYGTTASYGSSTAINSSLVTSHSVTVTGLTQNTLYHYRVLSRNAASYLGTSTDQTATTPNDTTPPNISNITNAVVGETNFTVTWTTNENSDSQIEYGTTTSYGTLSPASPDTNQVTNHSVATTGVASNSLYHYRVLSRDAFGNLATSTDRTVTLTDTTAPQITTGPTVASVTATTATISWTTNENADTRVRFGPTTNYENGEQINSTLTTNHSYTITGIGGFGALTTYQAKVRTIDSGGNATFSGNFSFTTDGINPVISSVSNTNLSSTGVTLTWTTDEAATSLSECSTSPSFTSPISSGLDSTLVSSHSQVVALAPSTLYYCRVTSTDAAQNTTVNTSLASFTTPAAP